jgi:hypothetical protein
MNLQTRALGIYPAAASKHRDHPGSDGLLIQADRSTVATDGHILLEYTPEPSPVGSLASHPVEAALIPFLLPKKRAEAIHRAMTPRTIQVNVKRTNGKNTAVIEIGKDLQVAEPKMPGTFPDYQPVMTWARRHRTRASVALGREVLRALVDSMDATDTEVCTLAVGDPMSPVLIQGISIQGCGPKQGRGNGLHGCLMPYHIGRATK